MFTRDRIALTNSQTQSLHNEALIHPVPINNVVDLQPGRFRTANSLSFWFGAESAFADTISMKIIGSMAYERHAFDGSFANNAETVLEKWRQSVNFKSR